MINPIDRSKHPAPLDIGYQDDLRFKLFGYEDIGEIALHQVQLHWTPSPLGDDTLILLLQPQKRLFYNRFESVYLLVVLPYSHRRFRFAIDD